MIPVRDPALEIPKPPFTDDNKWKEPFTYNPYEFELNPLMDPSSNGLSTFVEEDEDAPTSVTEELFQLTGDCPGAAISFTNGTIMSMQSFCTMSMQRAPHTRISCALVRQLSVSSKDHKHELSWQGNSNYRLIMKVLSGFP